MPFYRRKGYTGRRRLYGVAKRAVANFKRYPPRFFGRAYFRRGSEQSLNTFGASAKSANETQMASRRATGFTGRGAYWGRNIGRALGSFAGGAIGSRVGMGALGSQVGGYLGGEGGDYLSDKIDSHFAGRGAYTTHNNLINPSSSHRPMSSANDETGDVIISHSEYLQDLVPTSNGFQTQYFQPINPGLTGFAPWLSQIASFFEEYEMIQCVITYKSMVTEGNSTASGTVIIATQYNPTSSAFVVKQNMENYEHANSCKVTNNLMHGVECDPSKKSGSALEYIRTGVVPTGQDPKTYDLGVIQVATNGCTPMNIGELWIHYKVRLSKAKVVLPGAISSSSILSSNFFVSWLGTGIPVGATNNALLGSEALNRPFTNPATTNTGSIAFLKDVYAYDKMGGFYFNGATNTITFPTWVTSGKYFVQYAFSSGTTASTANTITVTNGQNVNVATYNQSPSAGATGTFTTKVSALIDVNAPGGTVCTVKLSFGVSQVLPAGGYAFVNVLQVDSNFGNNII